MALKEAIEEDRLSPELQLPSESAAPVSELELSMESTAVSSPELELSLESAISSSPEVELSSLFAC